MQKAGLLIGRGTFIGLLILVVLTACAQQGAPTLPTAAPAGTEAAEGEGTEEAATPEADETGLAPAAQSEQITIDGAGNIGPPEISIDPNTELELQIVNINPVTATLSLTTGSGVVGFVMPAAMQEGASVTARLQVVTVRYDEPGIYQISCLSGGCTGSVVVQVGQVEEPTAAPEEEPTGEAVMTPEAATTPEAEATGEAVATPEAEATEAPEATGEAVATPGAEVTEAPEATGEAVATPEAEATEAPEATGEAVATPGAEVTEAPEATTAPIGPPEPTAAPEEATEAPEATEGTGAGAEEVAVSGDPAAGETLFNQTLIQTSGGVAAGCVTCHYVQADLGDFTGPNLAGISEVAAERVEGQSAVEYLQNSIVNPNDYTVDGFTAGVMPQNFGDILTEEEIDNLVAYLMTL